MKDQAERLRQLAKKRNGDQGESDARVIAITSGKGGVGKTNCSVNLALALQQAGKKTLIFDADLGMANIDVVLGIVPSYTLSHVIHGQKRLQEIMLEGPGGIKILPGSSGAEDLVGLSDQQIQRLIQDWQSLEEKFDFILVDTGAGIHADVLTFLQAADDIVVLLTPEPPSITDAYGLIKVISHKELTSTLRLVINQVDHEAEGQRIYKRVSKVTQDFLKLDIELLGMIPYDEKVSAAVKRQKPFLLEYPNCNASKGVEKIVATLLEQKTTTTGNGMKQFFKKVFGYFNR